MEFISCTTCLSEGQQNSDLIVTCPNGSETNVGNAMTAFSFLLIGGTNFCSRCGQQVRKQSCTGIAGKPPISRKPTMRSATGEAGAVSNDTIRKYAQFALVISLVALSVNIYSMRKKK